MTPQDSAPQRPGDIIDFTEDFCARRGSVAEVSPKYYQSFLALSDAEMEAFARAVLSAQAKEARRLALAEPADGASSELISFASNTMVAIAIGIARFGAFGQLGLYKRLGPEPEPEVHDAMMAKIERASPIIERVVREFIQQQRGAGSNALSPAQSVRHGWQTTSDPEVESARFWQVQLSMFPLTPRQVCERIGLNWLAACQLHAAGWLSFDPRRVNRLDEAQEAELQLVGSLVVAGCDAEMLSRLLHGLRRPYQYRPGTIYLDWASACWRLLPVAKEPDPPQVFADWIDSLKESCDRGQLEDIARDVAAALKSLPLEAPEPD
jgi:hypothetical protein